MVNQSRVDESRSFPSRLSLPPTCSVSPPVSTRIQILPVHQLEWENFERLCLRLLRHKQEVEKVVIPGVSASVTRLYGSRGQAQQGIDVYSRDPISLDAPSLVRNAVCLQARRIKKVTKTGIKNAVSDFLGGSWASTSRKFIYATSASGVATEFTKEIEAQSKRLALSQIELTVWDQEEISSLLREMPELIDDFFGRAWVEAFLGAEAAQRLGTRLDGSQVARLRAEIRRIYTATFGLADPRISGSDLPQSSARPQTNRFVIADLRPIRTAEAYPRESAPSPTPKSNFGVENAPQTSPEASPVPLETGRVPSGFTNGDWLGVSGAARRSSETSRVGTVPANEWLGTSDRQVVIGEPGAGKSTLLRHLVLDLLSEVPLWSELAERWGDRLPIWLPFHFFTQRVTGASGKDASVVQVIKAWIEQHDVGHAWPLIEQALSDDRLLLVVDGLDEWSGLQAGEYAAAALETFATTRSIALVVSSRPYGLERLKLGSGWSYSRMASLSPSQQRSLAGSCLASGVDETAKATLETTVSGFMAEIEASADLRAMAGVPLFLVLLANLRAATGARLPNRRFEVFEKAIHLLVRDHPSRRRVAASITTARAGLQERSLLAVLADVAFQAQQRGDFAAISQEHLRNDLIAALRDPEVLALEHSEAIQQAGLIADIAEGELGLLVRQGPREVAFVHRCLQEQLAAAHITTRLSKVERHELQNERIGDVRWHEVLLGVLWQTSRPGERSDLAGELRDHGADTPAGLHAPEMLAEVVFGPYDLPGQLGREQAQVLADRAEIHPLLSHRVRLAASLVAGIDNVTVQAIVEKRLVSWTLLVEPPTQGLIWQLGQVPAATSCALGPVPALVDALQHLNTDENFSHDHRDIELFQLAAIDQGPHMRRALLRALAVSSVPHWPAAALLEHFPNDAEVISKLHSALMTKESTTTGKLAGFAGRVLGQEAGREWLLGMLRSLAEQHEIQTSVRYDMIATGLADCCEDITDPAERERICAEAFVLLPVDVETWGRDVRFELAVRFFPCASAIAILERCGKMAGGRHLPGLLSAYKDDPVAVSVFVERARQLIRVPPASVRYAINEILASEFVEPEFVRSVCGSWADENFGPVKCVAPLAYHRALVALRARGSITDQDWGHALTRLGEVASCYGDDHEARRRAAWVGMCVIGDWTPVENRFETYGDSPALVSVDLASDLLSGPNEVLLDQLGHRWAELREHFGAELVNRLSGKWSQNPESAMWGQLATVASRFPALDADLRLAIDVNPQLLSEASVVTWFVADQGRNRSTATDILERQVVAENNHRNDAVWMAQDADLYGLDVSRLVDMMSVNVTTDVAWFGDAKLETLAVLRPSHPFVQKAWTQITKLIRYPVADSDGIDPADGDDADHDAQAELHVHTYLAVAYSCMPSEDVGWLVARDLEWINCAGNELTYYETALVRQLRRRLRSDPIAVQAVLAKAQDLPARQSAQILALLGSVAPSGSLTLEIIDSCLSRISEEPFAILIRDVALGANISAQTALLNASFTAG